MVYYKRTGVPIEIGKGKWSRESHGNLIGIKSWDFVISHEILSLNLTQICALFADIKKFSITFGSRHFPNFSAKCCECCFRAERLPGKIEKQSGEIHGTNLQTLETLGERWVKIFLQSIADFIKTVLSPFEDALLTETFFLIDYELIL